MRAKLLAACSVLVGSVACQCASLDPPSVPFGGTFDGRPFDDVTVTAIRDRNGGPVAIAFTDFESGNGCLFAEPSEGNSERYFGFALYPPGGLELGLHSLPGDGDGFELFAVAVIYPPDGAPPGQSSEHIMQGGVVYLEFIDEERIVGWARFSEPDADLELEGTFDVPFCVFLL